MKKLLLAVVAAALLSSCGHDYMVRSVDTNNIVYMNDSQIGEDSKVGDTIRMEASNRIDSVTVQKVIFTGVVISVDKKD